MSRGKTFDDHVIHELQSLGDSIKKFDDKEIQILNSSIRNFIEKMSIDSVKNAMAHESINKNIIDNKKCNEIAHKKITDKIDKYPNSDILKLQRTKVGHTYFRWIIGILVGSLITLSVIQVMMQQKLSKHIYFAEYLYQEISGNKWNEQKEKILKLRKEFLKEKNVEKEKK